MPEPVAPQQIHNPDCPDQCEWMTAYLRLREMITYPQNAAAPAKCLGGGLTLIDTWLARDLGIPLSSLYDIIQADFDKVHKPKGANDDAERRITLL